MAEQKKTIQRTPIQNRILDLEQKYMKVLEDIITDDAFVCDLKTIEKQTQEFYDELKRVWGKKNKIKEVSERLLRHHIYTKFVNCSSFYSSPISSDIALELSDIILNLDIKTIDKVGNAGELFTTQFEHNQTSFLNKPVLSTGPFLGFTVKSNLKSMDANSGKPILTYLIKIGYSDDGNGIFNLINSSDYPSLVLTCLPNGSLSNLFDSNLFQNYKDYNYYDAHDGVYYKPRYITSKDEFSSLTNDLKFLRIEQTTDIPNEWKRIVTENNKVGYFDTREKVLWWCQDKKNGNHWDIYLRAVKDGNTARFNDEWLKKRYNSRNEPWSGERLYYRIYDDDADTTTINLF